MPLDSDKNSLDSVSIGEPRTQFLLRTGRAVPRFLQGAFPFVGRGIYAAATLHDVLTYTVPMDSTAEVVYFRGGNLSDDLIYFTLSVNGHAVRYFPVGPKSDFHVPLAIVETYTTGAIVAVCIAAPRGLGGTAIVDVGIVEVRTND